jgi:hypothetical protein
MRSIEPTVGRRTATDKRMHMRLTTGFFINDHKLHSIVDPVERMAALGLLAACIGQAREHGTDGHVDLAAICEQIGLPMEFGKLLIAEGAVHQADHGCRRCPQPRAECQYVHDYLDHHPSAAEEQRAQQARQQGGYTAASKRWNGHVPADKGKEKRPPGRPRKHPLPESIPAVPAAGAKRGPGRPRKEPGPKAVRVFEPWVHEAANQLADLIARNDPNHKRPNVTDTWLNTLRLIHEADGREPEKIMRAIRWSQSHHFYSTIILSPANLRKHYNPMSRRAAQEGRNGASPGGRPRNSAPAPLPKDNALFDDDYMPGGS